MSQVTLVLVIALSITAVHGMDCSLGNGNFFDKIKHSCPVPILGDPSQEYCCLRVSDQSFYCCNAQEWALQTGLGIIIPAIIAVLVVFTVFVLCISCLCCRCCPWYRRRHRGTVYGTVQRPGVVHPPPGVNPPQSHIVNNVYPQYTANQPVPPGPYQSQPPPYSAELYAKQAPYNPNYPQ